MSESYEFIGVIQRSCKWQLWIRAFLSGRRRHPLMRHVIVTPHFCFPQCRQSIPAARLSTLGLCILACHYRWAVNPIKPGGRARVEELCRTSEEYAIGPTPTKERDSNGPNCDGVFNPPTSQLIQQHCRVSNWNYPEHAPLLTILNAIPETVYNYPQKAQITRRKSYYNSTLRQPFSTSMDKLYREPNNFCFYIPCKQHSLAVLMKGARKQNTFV